MTNKRKTRKRGGAPPNTNQKSPNINDIKKIEASVRFIVGEAERRFQEKELEIQNIEKNVQNISQNIDRKVDETIGKKVLTVIKEFVTNNRFNDELEQLKKGIDDYNKKKFENSQNVMKEFNAKIESLNKESRDKNQNIETEIKSLKDSIETIGVKSDEISKKLMTIYNESNNLKQKFDTTTSLVNEKLKVFDECNDKLNIAAHSAEEIKKKFDNVLHYIEKIVKKELRNQMRPSQSRNTRSNKGVRMNKTQGAIPYNQYSPKPPPQKHSV
jgi:chromosome segregation ATPase